MHVKQAGSPGARTSVPTSLLLEQVTTATCGAETAKICGSNNPPTSQSPITPEDFIRLLPSICNKETSYSPKEWAKENPLYGQCTVVSLLAQNFFGGDLLRGTFKNNRGRNAYHYWNRLPNGTEHDFTRSQFGDNYPKFLANQVKRRKDVLRIDSVEDRYKKLALNLAKHLNKDNPIFDDPIYKLCFFNALDSQCQKMKFGCVITKDSEVVYQGNNKTLAPLKGLCDPKCIRFLIQSRTEQMLGACGHAEELGLWEAAKKGILLQESELYIAGLYPNGLPWLKKAPEHTCLRCSTQMYEAGIKKVYVPVNDKWVGLTPEEALKTALAYATKEKVV